MANSYITKNSISFANMSNYIWSNEGGSKTVTFSSNITNTQFVIVALRYGYDIRTSSIIPIDEFVSGRKIQSVGNFNTGTVIYGQATYVNPTTVTLELVNPDNAWVNNFYIRFV